MSSLALSEAFLQPIPDDEPTEADLQWWAALHQADASAPEPDGLTLTFPDWLKSQASYYRSLGNTAATWLAREIDQLAAEACLLHALTPDQYDDRQATYWEPLE